MVRSSAPGDRRRLTLYLHCAVCSRKQADGLLSGAAWGRAELPGGATVGHPAVNRGSVLVCPTCRGAHDDWRARALSAVGLGGGTSLNAAS